MKANLFKVLDTMNTEHEGSVNDYFSNNIENINAGKKGWGFIRIAIILNRDYCTLVNLFPFV